MSGFGEVTQKIKWSISTDWICQVVSVISKMTSKIEIVNRIQLVSASPNTKAKTYPMKVAHGRLGI